jgi:hypothetical protein
MTRKLLLSAVALVTIGSATTGWAIIIDSFDEPAGPVGQVVSQTGGGGTNGFVSGSMLGGQRDVSAGVSTGSTTTNTISINVAGGGVLTQSRVGPDTVFGLVQWDGGDSAGGIDPEGLGGLDFTAGGADAIKILVSTTDAVTITFSVFTQDPGFLFSSLTLPVSNAAPAAVYFPYASFSGSADFANVGAIMMTINGLTNGVVTTVDLVETAQVVPEPSTLTLAALGLVSLGVLAARRRTGRITAGLIS